MGAGVFRSFRVETPNGVRRHMTAVNARGLSKMLASEYYGPFPLYKFKQTRVLNGERPVPNSDAWPTHVFGINEKAERAILAK